MAVAVVVAAMVWMCGGTLGHRETWLRFMVGCASAGVSWGHGGGEYGCNLYVSVVF